MSLEPPSPRRTRVRRSAIGIDDIAEAAVRIMARDGYDGVSMRTIAAELGVQPGALYWHVKSRAALDDLLFDRLLADFHVDPDPADWRSGLAAYAHALRRHVRSRRDMVRLWRGRLVLGPNVLRCMETLLGLLRAAGLSGAATAHAYAAFLDYVLNFAAMDAAAIDRAGAERAAATTKAQLRETLAALPRDLYPNLVQLAEPLTRFDDIDVRFQFGLDALIGGIERLAPPSS